MNHKLQAAISRMSVFCLLLQLTIVGQAQEVKPTDPVQTPEIKQTDSPATWSTDQLQTDSNQTAQISPIALDSADSQQEPGAGEPEAEEAKWIQLFNGKDLTGWTPKFAGFPLGENFGDTYRVQDGLLKVVFDPEVYGEKYENRFGHLFYNTPYSHYRLRIEYKFNGQKYPNAPRWNLFNSGVMVHGQDPQTMGLNQGFPASIEMQFLADVPGKKKRNNLNICTPASHVVIDGQLVKQHVIESNNPAPPQDQWQTVEIFVNGSSLLEHRHNGKAVIRYSQPQFDPGDKKWLDPEAPKTKAFLADLGEKRLIVGGSISLQAEGHQLDFRKVELLPLPGNRCEYIFEDLK